MTMNLQQIYDNKMKLGESLVQSLNKLTNTIIGLNKLKTKIKQEISSLTKIHNSGQLKKEHILCTNLNHYEALVSELLQTNDCTSVLEVFHYFLDETDDKRKLSVDIVCNGKRKWKKVIARNPKALVLISEGEGEYGQKSIIDQAKEFMECSKQNLYLFKPPTVEFIFAGEIENELRNKLNHAGISVSDKSISYNLNTDNSLNDINYDEQFIYDDVKELNLDVSTMLAYVSSLTNTGNCKFSKEHKVLNQLAEYEKKQPVKPILDRIFNGRKLYACAKAVTSFKTIVDTLAGKGEKERATKFLEKITEVPDVYCDKLKTGGQIKERSLAIFGTGLSMQTVTVTANYGFVRAAKNQGVDIPVFLHGSRALTEQKELN